MQLACGLQECPTELLPENLMLIYLIVSHLQHRFREFGSTSNWQYVQLASQPQYVQLASQPRVSMPAQDLHVRLLHLCDCLTSATQTADETEEYFCL